MAKDLVLVTGATGFLGFRVLLYTLEQGYQVRAAVRSEAKAKIITSNPAFKALNRESQLSFITVPDFLAPGAFDEAIQGVKYIIHVASPIPLKAMPDNDYNKHFIQPAVQGTLNVFESAQKAGSIKRIVVTSSVVANTGREGLDSFEGTVTAETRVAFDKGPYADPSAAYPASKVAALNQAEEWIEKEKPAFDVVHIHPSYIFGRDDLYTSVADFMGGTNSIPLAVATGKSTAEKSMAFCFNHVADTARAHVLSLDQSKVPGNQSYLLTSDGSSGEKWEDIFAILEKRYPEALEKGIFKRGSAWTSGAFKADVRKTESTFGFKLASLEEAVVPIFDQFLELLAKEQK